MGYRATSKYEVLTGYLIYRNSQIIILLTYNPQQPRRDDMRSLKLWEEVTGILTQIQQRENQTVVTVGDTVIAVSDISQTLLDKTHNKEASIVRTKSGPRLAINGDEQ